MAKNVSDYVRIERSREARLWISQVVVPVVIGAAYIYSNPQAREWVENKKNNVVNFVNTNILKKES